VPGDGEEHEHVDVFLVQVVGRLGHARVAQDVPSIRGAIVVGKGHGHGANVRDDVLHGGGAPHGETGDLLLLVDEKDGGGSVVGQHLFQMRVEEIPVNCYDFFPLIYEIRGDCHRGNDPKQILTTRVSINGELSLNIHELNTRPSIS